LNSLLIKIASFTVCDRANNSASVLDVVTISYLFALYAIGPPNSFIMYPCELFLLTELSANNASLAQINDCALLLPSLPLSYPLLRIPVSPSTVHSFLISSIVEAASLSRDIGRTSRSILGDGSVRRIDR
jgi:hypothetical protein